ncbi:MAG: DUF421 domain-containing protein [Bryobacterales bacterium]|nr:DUF421 domain-containing protein [Bryobacterales bacterium]
MGSGMFGLKLSVLEKIARPILVYAVMVLFLRLFGKRELAQLNPFDLVVLLSLSNTVQNAIIGDDNSVTGGVIGAFSLMAFNYLVVRFFFKHRRLDQILEGTPAVLIENGRLKQKALAKELLTERELATAAHRQGFKKLSEVKRCVIEPGGGFLMEGNEPPAGERQHAELLARLDKLSLEIAFLRGGVA